MAASLLEPITTLWRPCSLHEAIGGRRLIRVNDRTQSKTESGDSEFERQLAQARAGCPIALGELIEAGLPYLTRIAAQQVPLALRAKLDTGDLVQETALEAVCCFREFSGQRRPQFYRWMRQILLNNAANTRRYYLHAEKRKLSRESVLGPRELITLLERHHQSPDERASVQEEYEQLERRLKRLSPKMQRVLRLRHFEQQTFTNIGQALACSGEAARKLYRRAIARLRREFHESSETGDESHG